MADSNKDALAASQKRQAEIVAEQEEAQSVQPTPTPEEVDRAKLGLDVPKAAAKSTDEPATRTVEADAAGTYKTRGK